MPDRFCRCLPIALPAIVMLALGGSPAVADPLYSVTDLGSGGWSLLNNNAQVAGNGYTTPYSVNRLAQILAGGFEANGSYSQFLLTPVGEPVPPPPVYPEAPVPEPSTLAVLGAGMLMFAIQRARKRD